MDEHIKIILDWGIEHYSSQIDNPDSIGITKKLFILKKEYMDQDVKDSTSQEHFHEILFLIFHGLSKLKDPFAIFETTDAEVDQQEETQKQDILKETKSPTLKYWELLENDALSKKLVMILNLLLQLQEKRSKLNLSSVQNNSMFVNYYCDLKKIVFLRLIFETPISKIEYKSILNFLFPISCDNSSALENEAQILKDIYEEFLRAEKQIRRQFNDLISYINLPIGITNSRYLLQLPLFENRLSVAKMEFRVILDNLKSFVKEFKKEYYDYNKSRLLETSQIPKVVLEQDTVLSRISVLESIKQLNIQHINDMSFEKNLQLYNHISCQEIYPDSKEYSFL
ncbi:hypothetical protein BB560_002864 [Smittium megazygosporum]|uniref:Uncharacterized protein n=1 Tax=Smittium megazygosporum TaxID=133381 RepID=A0A2T9ZDQ8_9FUNG|nr:hypothetical protein BB560_002864 [Smittium megazygosporum]